MNVFRPSQDLLPSNASVPVLLWIYGGGFLQGESSIFNATEIIVQSVLRVRHTSCLSGCAIVLTGRLQGTPIIYVSVNYRLGPFGFPQGAEAEQASRRPRSYRYTRTLSEFRGGHSLH